MVQISLNVILFSLSLSLVNLGGVPSTGSHSSRVPASAINSSTGVAPAVNPFAHLVSHDPYPILFESCVCVCVCVCDRGWLPLGQWDRWDNLLKECFPFR